MVQQWLVRAGTQRLDRVDWSDHRQRGHAAARRTPAPLEATILALRRQLRDDSVLGEYGTDAIAEALRAEGLTPPARRTIARILVRGGVVRRATRVRRPAPPPGWHLPAVCAGTAEIDLFDCIEDLKLAGGPCIDVLTLTSLHGRLPGAWPVAQARTSALLPLLQAHWEAIGCPAYAQFDNDTRFQGPHQHRDRVGRVIRLCLAAGIVPVFAVPREFGLQNPVEQFNAQYQQKVWRRVHFPSLAALQAHTQRYIAALRARRAARIAHAPARTPWGHRGAASQLIYVRRTSEHGTITVLGRTWPVDRHWAHRLVRAEVNLARGTLTCFGLRRSDPAQQPLLAEHAYDLVL